MTLATRCPKCSTTFRIVPDQLKISEGLVRCGQCQHVFNARQHQITPLALTAEHQEPSSSKKSSREEKDFSELLDDSNFIDSLFSEFHIGWADTVIDYQSPESNAFSQAIAQSKNVPTEDIAGDIPDEIIELDDTEFTESLMRLDDTSYDLSEMLEVEEDIDDELLTSEMFTDSLMQNLSLGSEDTILSPKIASKTTHQIHFQEEHNKAHDETENMSALEEKTDIIIPRDLAVLSDVQDVPPPRTKPETLKPIVIPPITGFSDHDEDNLPKEQANPLTIETTKGSSIAEESSTEKRLSRKRTGKSIAEYSEEFANAFSTSETTSPIDSDVDSSLLTESTHEESDYSATNLSQYNNDSNFSTTRLDEKYEKIASSLQEQQLASLSFVKQNRGFWNAPIIKMGVTILALALLVLLGVQAIYYRNYLVSYFPAIRPALAMVSEPLGLTVNYPISFDLNKNVTIDASSLNTMPDGSYQLEVIIRNRASYAIAVPYLELTLQNVSGEVIARKIFSPEELGIHQIAIDPQKELFIRTSFTANTQGIAGVGYSTALLYL